MKFAKELASGFASVVLMGASAQAQEIQDPIGNLIQAVNAPGTAVAIGTDPIGDVLESQSDVIGDIIEVNNAPRARASDAAAPINLKALHKQEAEKICRPETGGVSLAIMSPIPMTPAPANKACMINFGY